MRSVGARALVWMALAGSAVAMAGCSDNASPTSPTDTTPAPTAADPSIDEQFDGTLAVNGASFYSFEVTSYGTVTVTLQNVGGVTGVPESVWVGIGVGVPEGTDCSTTTSLNTQAGGGPHLSSVLAAGTYCARVYDIGNLAAATPFAVRISHP
jgi:hypothetical protein